MPEKPKAGAKSPAPAAVREERLAAALRANLKRRKAQDRAREAGEGAAPAASSPQSGHGPAKSGG